MSFLNPVNEPVLRFSSTDADAPQINYAARTAGDVKTVLKACLVTGYGAKASAGWSIVNEVDHVAEFVSPSAALSDYRLMISDANASSTTWNYYYQDTLVNPPSRVIGKSFTAILTTDSKNGWQLIVTERGFWFVEIFASYYNQPNIICRATYFGVLKSALANDSNNISFWTIGYGSPAGINISQMMDNEYPDKRHQLIGGYNSSLISTIINTAFRNSVWDTQSEISIVSPLYLFKGNVFLAEHPGIYAKMPVKNENIFDCYDTVVDGRPMLQLCMTHLLYSSPELKFNAKPFLIPLDTWSY